MSQSNFIIENPKIQARNVNLFYNASQALFDVSIDVAEKTVTALIGPSGCGKSSFLRCINRMNDTIEGCRVTGSIILDNYDICAENVDVVSLRSKVGMVFQKPTPFLTSIYDNVAYGPKIHGLYHTRSQLDNIVEENLIAAGLWGEVKDRLHMPATQLSGGQKQRLCIARTIAVNPDIILMDEPCSALDPIATAKVEELIDRLKKDYTIVIVTHSMQQAARVSEYTAFFHLGNIVEFNTTEKIFTNPDEQKTEEYITGRFG